MISVYVAQLIHDGGTDTLCVGLTQEATRRGILVAAQSSWDLTYAKQVEPAPPIRPTTYQQAKAYYEEENCGIGFDGPYQII